MQNSAEPRGCVTVILRILGLASEPERFPYELKNQFLSPAEMSFYHVLRSVLGPQQSICCKVRVADILYVTERQKSYTYFNRISAKHVDFLVCTPDTMRPLAAIELDDSSHSASKRQERDNFLNEAFKAANLPLIRFEAKRGYKPDEVRERLTGVLTPSGISSTNVAAGSGPQRPDQTTPQCPNCGSAMVLRTASQGSYKGQQFYGCTNYPTCKGRLPA